jgi:hypothetical protein
MSKVRKTLTRNHPWTRPETSALYPPDKRWRQRSRQLLTKVCPGPSSSLRSKDKTRRGILGAHSHPRRELTLPGPLASVGSGTCSLPKKQALCLTAFHEARWLLCLPAVGIVPPRTKSPTDEELAPSAVVRRTANGLTNGLSSRVSAALQALRACAG